MWLSSYSNIDASLHIRQVVPALAIHDTMKHIGSKVATVGFGACLGMTGFLMAVGTKASMCRSHLISCVLPA